MRRAPLSRRYLTFRGVMKGNFLTNYAHDDG